MAQMQSSFCCDLLVYMRYGALNDPILAVAEHMLIAALLCNVGTTSEDIKYQP